MLLKSIAIVAGLALAPVAAHAQQQQMLPFQQDMQVQSALNQMYQGMQMLCQSGNPQACQGMQQIQGTANYMQQASMACMQGNMQACQMYQQLYMQVSYDFNTFQSYVQQGYAQQNQGMNVQPTDPQVAQNIWEMNQQTNQEIFEMNQQTYQMQQESWDGGHSSYIDSIWSDN